MKWNPRLRRYPRLFVLLGSVVLLLLVLVVILVLAEPTNSPASATPDDPPARVVSVVSAVADSHTVQITGFAEVQPRWRSTLRAQVDGELIWVAEAFQPGQTVHAGQLLARVDSIAWVANLAEAVNRQTAAKLTLLHKQQEASEARLAWRESGLEGEPDSPLVLHEPQIEAARVELDAARTARDWAARQLAETSIRAPYAGVVTARHISRSELVVGGEPVAEIVATDTFELALPIPESQWRSLPVPLLGTPANLRDPGGPGRWSATVIRAGAEVNPSTRMRTLFLAVSDPLSTDPPLLPGSFVEVSLEGRPRNGVLKLPEGTLTRSGHVWYVDDDSTLQRFDASQLFSSVGSVYVAEPRPQSGWRIVRFPLESYLVGQSVRPDTTVGAEAKDGE